MTSASTTPPLLSVKVTVPKVPKPQRTQVIFEHVLIGLSQSISELKAKVSDLTTAVTNGYTAMSKQLLQSQAHLRHMEQRASNLEKLKASYEVHLKMRDGIENMFEAYKKTPGKNQGRNLASIKAGWKECVQTLCLIEAQTEALLGTFRFQIEKLIGFARLCPGDIYEIQIKYGQSSKFRARTKISKDGQQTWDSTNFALKITVHDLLLFRINEIKFLGKNLLIGERVFDTKDLFSTTQTQRLTINANTSGTLKLSMLITWLPFENSEDTFIYYNPTQYLTINTKEKRPSAISSTTNSPNLINMNHSLATTPSSIILNHSPSFSSCPEEPEERVTTTKTVTETSTNKTSSTPCHSLLLTTSSSSNSSLYSSSNKNVTSSSNNPTTNSNENGGRRMSQSSIQNSTSMSSYMVSSDSLDVGNEVELLLGDMVEQVAARDDLKLSYERVRECLKSFSEHYEEIDRLKEHLKTVRDVLKRRLGVQLNGDVDLDESSSLSDMLDDVFQYFDFLNTESDYNCSDGKEKEAIDSTRTSDLSRLMSLHLNRLWVILDELNFINKQNSSQTKLNQLEANLISRLSQEVDLFRDLDSTVDELFNIDAQNDVIEKHLSKSVPNRSGETQLTENLKISIWRKSLEPNSLFTTDLSQLTREFVEQSNGTRLLGDLFRKIASGLLADDNQQSKCLSLFHYSFVFDSLSQIDSSDLVILEQIINTIEDNTLLLELLKPNEFNVIERLSGLVQDAVLKDLIQLVLKTNDSDLRNRLRLQCGNMEQKLLKNLSELVLENLIALKVDDLSMNLAEKQTIKDRVQLLIEFMTSFSTNSSSSPRELDVDIRRL